MFSNWQYRLLALVLALACWYIVTGREKVEAWVEVPVEIVNAPSNLMVRGDGLPTSIRARLRGSKAIIRSLSDKQLAYSLDLSSLEPGENSVIFEKDNLTVPMALEVVDIDPPRLTLNVDKLVDKSLPVKLAWKGGPGEDYELSGFSIEPDTVHVRGPQPLVDKLKEIPTLVRDVAQDQAGEVSYDVGLALPEKITSDVSTVRVTLNFVPKTKNVWIRLPVTLDPEDVDGRTESIKPSTVQIQADVPLTILRQVDFKSLFQVTAKAPATMKDGARYVPVEVRLPQGCVLHKTVPEKVEVRVKKR